MKEPPTGHHALVLGPNGLYDSWGEQWDGFQRDVARNATEIYAYAFVALALIGVLSLILSVGFWKAHVTPPAPFNAAHADACRTLHAIARTAEQRAMAVLACEHEDPDFWTSLIEHPVAR